MFEKLSEMFPGAKYYEVIGHTHSEAVEKCSRLSLDNDHVIEVSGKVVYICGADIDIDIDWMAQILDPNAPVSSEE